MSAYEAALEIQQRLAATDPRNAIWQRDLSVSHAKLGDVLMARGDLDAALRAYHAALEIAERLASSNLRNAAWQRDLWVSYWRIADCLEQLGKDEESGAYWLQAFETLCGMKGIAVSYTIGRRDQLRTRG